MSVLDAIDFIGHMVEGGFGWRYILSSKYRKKIHAYWKGQSKLIIAGDIFSMVMSFIFFNLVIGAIFWAALTAGQ